LNLGKNTKYLKIWWAVNLINEMIILVIILSLDMSIGYYRNTQAENIIKLFLYGGLCILAVLRNSDMTAKDESGNYYQAMMNSYST